MALTDDELEALLRAHLVNSGSNPNKISDGETNAFWRVFEMPKEETELCWRLLEVARARNFTDEQLR